MEHLTSVDYWEKSWWKGQRPRRLVLYRDFDFELVRVLQQFSPGADGRILEVGAGGSRVLPYLARHQGARAAGIDYSFSGCRLLKENFRLQSCQGAIVCGDFLQPSISPHQFDLVYSLGVAEHFDDLRSAVQAHLDLVKPGGHLFVQSPNLQGMQGRILRKYAPALLKRHHIFGPSELAEVFRSLGLQQVRTGYLGSFLIGLGTDSDWIYLEQWPQAWRSLLHHAVRAASGFASFVFRLSPLRPHTRLLSAGFYALGRKDWDAE